MGALCFPFPTHGASPEAKVRLGGLLEDLECHVDNGLRFGPDGEILGRNGGVRGWLREHAPELSGRYKTLMRYKSLARRLRQAAGIADPVPADALLPPPPGPYAPEAGDTPSASVGLPVQMPTLGGAPPCRPVVPERARQTAEGILRGCPNTFAALFRAVDAALGEGG